MIADVKWRFVQRLQPLPVCRCVVHLNDALPGGAEIVTGSCPTHGTLPGRARLRLHKWLV